jgi:hypothetical protein
MAIFNSKLFVYQRVFSWGKMLNNGDFLKKYVGKCWCN